MSVPSSERKEASTKFLYEIYELNIWLAQTCNNGPKKYKANYGDFIIRTGLEALQLAQYANSIYISANMYEESFIEREMCLKKAESLIDNLSTTCQIYFELFHESGTSNDKIAHKKEHIGSKANEIISLLKGVQKSDKERYRKFKLQQ